MIDPIPMQYDAKFDSNNDVHVGAEMLLHLNQDPIDGMTAKHRLSCLESPLTLDLSSIVTIKSYDMDEKEDEDDDTSFATISDWTFENSSSAFSSPISWDADLAATLHAPEWSMVERQNTTKEKNDLLLEGVPRSISFAADFRVADDRRAPFHSVWELSSISCDETD